MKLKKNSQLKLNTRIRLYNTLSWRR